MLVRQINPTWIFTYQGHPPVELAGGLSVFIGDNGSGKTTLGLESIAWCLWGETVRGSKVRDGSVALAIDGYMINRARKNEKTTLRLLRDRGTGGQSDSDDLSGQTVTETQAKINQAFGTFQRFCATRVFSKNLLARFTAATNKERQALLEQLFGLDRVERTYQVARRRLGSAVNERDVLLTMVNRLHARIDEVERAVAPFKNAPDVALLEAELQQHRAGMEELNAKVAMLHQRVERLQDVASKSEARGGNVGVKISELERELAHVSQAKACPTCGRPFADASDTGQQEAADQIRQKLENAHAAFAEGRAEHNVLVKTLQNARQALQSAQDASISASVQERALMVRVEGARAAGRQVEEARTRRIQIEGELEALQAEVKQAEKKRDLLLEATNLLGPKGIRSWLLESGLMMIQDEANAILPNMGLAVQIRLASSTVRASGAEANEVSLEVTGAGGGQYAGASDGERARIDIALLMALSRVAQDRGLIVFDEVFDSLDDAGLSGVVEILEEMAHTRQVFVITHNPRFLDIMPRNRTTFRCTKDDNSVSTASVV